MKAYQYIGRELEVNGDRVRVLKYVGFNYYQVLDLQTKETKNVLIDDTL